MSRYNQKSVRPAVQHVMTSTTKANPKTKTHGGADGYAREAKSELFIRATSSFAGQSSFYEKAYQRDDRLVELTHQLAVTVDGWAWLSGFLPWLRAEGNIRTAPLLIASEAVKARLDQRKANGAQPLRTDPNVKTPRQLLDSVMQRPDEPGEMLAYWLSVHGRSVPQPVKRALADAARRLYSERSFLKYDSDSRGVRFADVLELSHPSPHPDKPWQGDLFKYAIDKRHNRDDLVIPETLPAIRARFRLNCMGTNERHDFAMAFKAGRPHGHMASDEVQSVMKLAMASQWEWFVSWLGTGTE